MKRIHKTGLFYWGIIVVTLALHFLAIDVFAAEKANGWRPAYDLILRWINFGIIVFVIIKYAKAPVMNFLRGQKEKLAREIKRLEDEKEDATSKVKETLKTIDESELRFAELKERIVRQGEKKKQEIVNRAQEQSKMMIEDAKQRIDTHFQQAKRAFRAELIDKATDLALERLPKEITPEDNERLTHTFITSTQSE